jgi:hypothetical protein
MIMDNYWYEGVSKSFRTGHLERELQIVKLSATRCSCIVILWVNIVSFVAITFCVASERVFIVVIVYFVIDSIRKLLDTPSYVSHSRPAFLIISQCTVKTAYVNGQEWSVSCPVLHDVLLRN